MNTLMVTLSGSPFDMGVQHGRLLKEQIHLLAKERYALAIEHAREHGVRVSRDQCLRLAHEHVKHQERYSQPVHEEFEGIAKGSQLSMEELLIANALTDFRDVLWQRKPAPSGVGGCTAFAVRPNRTVPGCTFIGQTWDMHASAEPFVRVFQRNPEDGPKTLAVSTAGCLSLIGLNEVGVAVCTNNLECADARPGVGYLAIIHEALRHTHFSAATRSVGDAHRASGHNYLMADGEGFIVNIETTAEEVEETEPKNGHFVHTNHYLSSRLAAKELEEDRPSSEHRLNRFRSLLLERAERCDVEHLQAMLGDQEGGPELGLCLEGTGRECRTCAFAVIAPERRTLWMTVGPPNRSRLVRFGLN